MMEVNRKTAPNAVFGAASDLLAGIGSWDCSTSDPENLQHLPLLLFPPSAEGSSEDLFALLKNENCPFHLIAHCRESTQDTEVGSWNALAAWLSKDYPHELYLFVRRDHRGNTSMSRENCTCEQVLGEYCQLELLKCEFLISLGLGYRKLGLTCYQEETKYMACFIVFAHSKQPKPT